MIRGFLLATLLSCLSLPCLAGVLEHTAVTAFKDLRRQENSELWEYSGFMVSRGGAIYYTTFPHTDKAPDHVSFDINSHLLFGDRLVAVYHNHPCHSSTHYTDFFSTADLIVAKFHDVPSFMLDNCTGLVHEFDWKVDTIGSTGKLKHVHFPKTQAAPNGTDKWVMLPYGRIVGDIGQRLPNLDPPEKHKDDQKSASKPMD